jgi:monoamine oxidase
MASERIEYDLIIVGAGIAGLRVGIKALKANPALKCCILEKYGYMGGRVVTWRKKLPRIGEVSWENGAGRISTSHKEVLGLLKEYGLTFVPISPETGFINVMRSRDGVEDNWFSDLSGLYLGPLTRLSKDVLAKHTLKELLVLIFGQKGARAFYEMFPYFCEIHTLRADIALEAFHHEMRSNEGFGVCAEGLSSLIDAMVRDFVSRGGWVLKGVEVQRVLKDGREGGGVRIECRYSGEKGEELGTEFVGRACVLALHSDAVKKIDGVKHLRVLKHLKMMPLLRMYAVFPVKSGSDGAWFEGLSKIVTNSPVRYIIPINAAKGIIMISYTDGGDAAAWDRILDSRGEAAVQERVMEEIRRLFPDRRVPDPLFFKLHYWGSGCTYWLPGKYDVAEESHRSLHPLATEIPGLFMCGESFAVSQCWMESALTQSDKLLELYVFRKYISKHK